MKNIIRSFGDLPKLNLDLPSETKNLPGDRPKTFGDKPGNYPGDFPAKKRTTSYILPNIRFEGNRFYTSDHCYETYRDGDYSYWRRTMVGEKNGLAEARSARGIDYVFLGPEYKEKALATLIGLIG